MKVKVNESKGRVLNWLVAQAEGAKGLRLHTYRTLEPVPPVWVVDWERDWIELSSLDYCNDGSMSYGIIEREGIGFFCNRTAADGARFKPDAGGDWRAFSKNKMGEHFFGPTSLIAALRCHVTRKLGEYVEVPEELL